jgi:hypothetical protein
VDVEERTPVEIIGLEMVDHQRSKRSPVQEVLGFRGCGERRQILLSLGRRRGKIKVVVPTNSSMEY